MYIYWTPQEFKLKRDPCNELIWGIYFGTISRLSATSKHSPIMVRWSMARYWYDMLLYNAMHFMVALNSVTKNVEKACSWTLYTQRYLFEILFNQIEISLYFPFSDWFGTKRTSVWLDVGLRLVPIETNQEMVNTIWFWFDLIWFRKDFSVCSISVKLLSKILSDWKCHYETGLFGFGNSKK